MKKKSKKNKNTIEKLALKLFLWLLSILSEKSVKKVMSFIAINIGYRIGIRKELVYRQMKRSLPHLSNKEVKDKTKKMYQHFGLIIVELFKSNKDLLVQQASIEGEENLQEAMNLDKSVLIATGHFGNWEMLGYFLLSMNIKLSAIAKKQRNPFFNQYFVDFRTSKGLDVIYQKRALKGILKAINEKRMIYFLHDQDARKTGEIMPFMNHDASVYTGIAKIALKADLPILPAYHIRSAEGKNIFRFEKIIYPKEQGLTSSEVMAMLNNSLSERIKANPELWFWVHKRWKSVEKQRNLEK